MLLLLLLLLLIRCAEALSAKERIGKQK